jgi:hypothetical protein
VEVNLGALRSFSDKTFTRRRHLVDFDEKPVDHGQVLDGLTPGRQLLRVAVAQAGLGMLEPSF